MHQSAHASTGLSLSPSSALPPSASASVSQQQQSSFAPPVSFNYPMSAENTPPTAAGSNLAAAPDNGTNQGNSSFRLHSNPVSSYCIQLAVLVTICCVNSHNIFHKQFKITTHNQCKDTLRIKKC